jgi:hypothetical protein
MYQPQRPAAQQQAPPTHSTNQSSFATGGNPTTVQDVSPHHAAATLNSEPTVAQTGLTDTAHDSEPVHSLEAPSYTFNPPATSPLNDSMDFTFEIEDLLGPMKAIENPLWMQTMMLPGFSWPTDENFAFFGNNNMAADGYQNFLAPQPTAVHLG